MRKVLSIMLIAAAASQLSASYSVMTSSDSDGSYLLMNALGDTLTLSDDLYYDEWSGLVAEQLNTGIYKVREDGKSIIVVTKPYSMDLLRYALWSQMEIDTIIVPSFPDIEPSELSDSSISQIVSFTEPSETERRLCLINGIDIDTIAPGEIVDIMDGSAVLDGCREIDIACPHCGETFTIII